MPPAADAAEGYDHVSPYLFVVPENITYTDGDLGFLSKHF